MLNLDFDAIRRETELAGHGSKYAVLDRYAGMAGVSRCTIYRELMRHCGKTREVTRQKRVDADSELIREVAKLKEKGRAMTRGASLERELSTHQCIRMLIDRGVPGAEGLNVSTVNRRLEEIGFRRRDPKVRIEAPYANWQWQMDFSRSKYFQMKQWDPARRDWLLRVHGRELHYKLDDRRMRTWISSAVDEHSRVEFYRAYAASGESWEIGLDLLHRIFNRDPLDPHPMRHVPERIKTDNGAFIKRKEVRAAFEAAGIEMRKTTPGNHDSQGKIEVRFRNIWMDFELPLAIRMGAGAHMWLSEYNELIAEYSISRLSLEHPLLKQTRGAVYAASIQARPQLVIEGDLLQHAFRVDERTVRDDLLFSWHGLAYRAPWWAQNKRVRVYENLNGDVMVEAIDDYGRCEPAVAPQDGKKYPYQDADDFNHRPAPTYRQTIQKEVERENGDPDKQAGWLMYQEGNRIFMPPRTRKVKPDSPFADRPEDENFKSADLARIHIGEQVYEMTGREYTYADVTEIFEPVLAVTLSKAKIREKIEDLRVVLRAQTMTLAKGEEN